MPTKPSTKYTWATDANFASGEATGHPTKVPPPGAPDVTQGLLPGDPAAVEFLNWKANIDGQWIDWVDGGTSDPDETAHIVETDATGKASLFQLAVTDELDVTGAVIAGTTDGPPGTGKIHLYDLEVTNELTVYDSASLKLDGVSVTGTFGVANEMIVTSGATLIVGAGGTLASNSTSSVALAGPLSRSGSAARTVHRFSSLTDENQDVACTSADLFVLPDDHGASRTYRMLTTSSPGNEIVEFVRRPGGSNNSILARVGSATPIVTLAPGSSARLFFDGSNWRLLSMSGNATAGGEA